MVQASLREHPPVLMLVGNKCDSRSERKVSSEEGRLLALVGLLTLSLSPYSYIILIYSPHTHTHIHTHTQDLHAMFSEMSALSGTNVMQAHQTLASLLLSRENEELEKARKASLSLNAQSQKRRCYC